MLRAIFRQGSAHISIFEDQRRHGAVRTACGTVVCALLVSLLVIIAAMVRIILTGLNRAPLRQAAMPEPVGFVAVGKEA